MKNKIVLLIVHSFLFFFETPHSQAWRAWRMRDAGHTHSRERSKNFGNKVLTWTQVLNLVCYIFVTNKLGELSKYIVLQFYNFGHLKQSTRRWCDGKTHMYLVNGSIHYTRRDESYWKTKMSNQNKWSEIFKRRVMVF